jgi:hypothetical protein
VLTKSVVAPEAQVTAFLGFLLRAVGG